MTEGTQFQIPPRARGIRAWRGHESRRHVRHAGTEATKLQNSFIRNGLCGSDFATLHLRYVRPFRQPHIHWQTGIPSQKQKWVLFTEYLQCCYLSDKPSQGNISVNLHGWKQLELMLLQISKLRLSVILLTILQLCATSKPVC